MRIKKSFIVTLVFIMTFAFTLAITGCSGSNDKAAESTTEEPTTEESTEHANSTNIYASMAGEYVDENSQRAGATLKADKDSDSVNIIVSWAGSATSRSEWEMNAVLDGEKLVYDDCTLTDYEYDEDGNIIEEKVEYTGKSGYFELGDQEQLLWTGAQDDDCKNCNFVPYVE